MKMTSTVADGPVETLGGSKNYGIVVLSHLRWSFVWQRPQQLLSRFAKQHPILFVEEPEFVLEKGDSPSVSVEPAMENVTVARMQLWKNTSSEEFNEQMSILIKDVLPAVNDNGAFDEPLLWFYNPMDAPWAIDAIPNRGIVYDCMDELSQFKFAPETLVANENKLIQNADVVFTGGYELWLKKSKQHENVHFFGCGVEFEHFALAQQQETSIPEDVASLNRPILGWFGVVDERVDYDLIAEMARKKPEWSFVMVGPVVKVDPASLPKAPNIHWLGGRDYSVLPNYCKAYDVCMMAFALNEATEFINPTKALEYLATGKPVISTPVRDVVRQYQDSVYIAESPDDFLRIAEEVVANPDRNRIEAGISRAQSCSWETTVATMQSLIAEAIGEVTPV